MTAQGKIAAKFYYNNYWIKFTFENGYYDNFMSFIEGNNIGFLGEMAIDWTNIPIDLHGKRNSYNLYQYIANNSDDSILIINFLNYFIVEIANFRYINNRRLYFSFLPSAAWQSTTFFSGYLPPTGITSTTTTTTTEPITTTTTTAATTTTTTIFETSTYPPETSTLPPLSGIFEIFGQLHNL